MRRSLVALALAGALSLIFFVREAAAQSSFVTPGGSQVDGKVEMCINASGAAVPCSGSGGTGVSPYQYSPSSVANSDQHNVSVATATSLTVPADAICANVSIRGGAVNWRWDGVAPTGSTGNAQAIGTMAQFCGRNILAAVQFIQQTGNTSTIDVTYDK